MSLPGLTRRLRRPLPASLAVTIGGRVTRDEQEAVQAVAAEALGRSARLPSDSHVAYHLQEMGERMLEALACRSAEAGE